MPSVGTCLRSRLILCLALGSDVIGPPSAFAQAGMTECHHAGGADVVIGEIYSVVSYARSGDLVAFSFGNMNCNLGDEGANFFAASNQHPAWAQNMYRLQGDRFEQIGLSWMPHAFATLNSSACGCGCIFTNSQILGAGCSTPESASINGHQTYLGPRSDINAHTGFFPFPPTDPPWSGPMARRLQVHVADLEVELNEGAVYFAEMQIVAADDSLNGFQNNSASHRRITVSPVGENWVATLSGITAREQPAIRAWTNIDPTVEQTDVQIPDDGLFIVAAKVSRIATSLWHFEYAVHNLNSHRSAGSFAVPIAAAATVRNVGFHDVDHHSGEPFDSTDWSGVVEGESVRWATESFESNPNANSLRWGTLFNFRFDTNLPPRYGDVSLGLFRPGTPQSVLVTTITPTSALGDFDVDGDLDLADYAQWSGCATGPSGNLTPLSDCGVFDTDVDDDIDLQDFQRLMNGFEPT